jgi:hypothetical protein|tara:strand:+ start:105 stop:473 length:369 start_codon:yes stop_codon:yes gene_type:complete
MIALFLGTGAEHLPSKVRTYKIWLATPFLQDFVEMLNSAQQTGTWDENGEKQRINNRSGILCQVAIATVAHTCCQNCRTCCRLSLPARAKSNGVQLRPLENSGTKPSSPSGFIHTAPIFTSG